MRFGKLWTGVIVTQVAVTALLLLAVLSVWWVVYQQNVGAALAALPKNEYFVAHLSLERGATQDRHITVRRELQRRLSVEPEVINATFAIDLPDEIDEDTVSLELSSSEGGKALTVREPVPIGANYFETFRLPLVAGRIFTASEIEERRNVVIVDETFVRLVLGGGSAVGQSVRESKTEQNSAPGPWQEIVGVVRDIAPAPNKTMGEAMFYRPAPPGNGWPLIVHSRTNSVARLRSVASATDPQIRLGGVMAIEKERERDHASVRHFLTVLGIVAATTLMLAGAGIHSLISFTLASRTREIGIRTALGASPLRIVRSILFAPCIKVVVGIVLGGAPGVFLVYDRLDWGVSVPMVAVIGVSVATFIIAVAFISSIWPVRRALKIPPTEALRTT
jgi:hypothetical protein